MREKISKYKFLFEELVKRDFKQKYKRTALGMAWSVLNPLLTLLIMSFVFKRFFGATIAHYTIYLFSGTLVWGYFNEATTGGMDSLLANASIFSKINVPKYMFLLSKNVSALVNFLLTVAIYFLFCALDGIPFHAGVILLIVPVICLTVFNVGMGMILSALFLFFRDTQYLYTVFLTLLNYLSAIFYTIDSFPADMQRLFLLNPVYVYIKYFRIVMIDGDVPSLAFNGLCALYALIALGIGSFIYKRYNQKFLYYI